MARSWQTAGLLLLGGVGCVGVGMMFGSGYPVDAKPLWREPSGAAVKVETTLPSFRDLVQRVESSVVSVQVTMPLPEVDPAKAAEDVGTIAYEAAMQAEPDTKSGSGFISHSDGLIVTSRHVVLGAKTIEVYLPNHGGFDADLVGQDPATDLAMLRLVNPPKNLPALMIGDSKKVAAGDWIVAVGNPYGFSRTVTAGLVSYVGRHLRHNDLGVSRDFLQISAQINPGSSGCPVFDVQGHVVGVSTQFASSAQGISFAVPSRTVKWALEKMRAQPDGTVRRGYLGIEFAPRGGVTENGEPMPGAVIVEVVKGDPAEKAGLQRGDVVLGVNGTPILAPKDLHECIVCSDPGTSIALQLLRDDQICDPIVAVLGEVGRRDASPTTN